MWLGVIVALFIFLLGYWIFKKKNHARLRGNESQGVHKEPVVKANTIQFTVPDSDAALGLSDRLETVNDNDHLKASEPDFAEDSTDNRSICKKEGDDLDLATSRDEAINESVKPVMRAPLNMEADQALVSDQIIFYLMADEGVNYGGYEMLQTIQSLNFHLGHNHIFYHCGRKTADTKDHLFYLASAVAPGTFDLSTIGDFRTPGLCLFFDPRQSDSPLAAFDTLLATIDSLVEELGGEVLDEKHERFTTKKMLLIRQALSVLEKQDSHVMSEV